MIENVSVRAQVHYRWNTETIGWAIRGHLKIKAKPCQRTNTHIVQGICLEFSFTFLLKFSFINMLKVINLQCLMLTSTWEQINIAAWEINL